MKIVVHNVMKIFSIWHRFTKSHDNTFTPLFYSYFLIYFSLPIIGLEYLSALLCLESHKTLFLIFTAKTLFKGTHKSQLSARHAQTTVKGRILYFNELENVNRKRAYNYFTSNMIVFYSLYNEGVFIIYHKFDRPLILKA